MQEAIKTIDIAGKAMRVTGSPGDGYFANLEGFQGGHHRLENYVRRNLAPDAVCMDIGANIGLTALLLATACPAGHVYAFEAVPSNAAFLRRNLALNGITNCTVVEVALGADRGKVAFYVAAAGSFVVTDSRWAFDRDRVVEVPLRRLDEWVAEQPAFDRLDFVKMDVEGYEPAVLAGGAGTIERFQPPIYMEFNSWCLGFAHAFSPFRFASALWQAFEVYELDGQGGLHPAAGGEVSAFLHRNMVQNGTVDDVLLRLRPGVSVPDLATFTATEREVRQATEMAALLHSTSWRVTAPLRALGRMLGRS